MKFYRPWIALLTLWFALLQTVAPLMHAHAAGDNPADDGPHMHMMEVPAFQEAPSERKHPFHWHVHASKSHGQIIGLSQAISEKDWLQAWSEIDSQLLLFAVLPALIALVFSTSIPHPSGQPSPARRRSLTGSSPQVPRAPPFA